MRKPKRSATEGAPGGREGNRRQGGPPRSTRLAPLGRYGRSALLRLAGPPMSWGLVLSADNTVQDHGVGATLAGASAGVSPGGHPVLSANNSTARSPTGPVPHQQLPAAAKDTPAQERSLARPLVEQLGATPAQ